VQPPIEAGEDHLATVRIELRRMRGVRLVHQRVLVGNVLGAEVVAELVQQDTCAASSAARCAPLAIAAHTGDRTAPLPLFHIADDSEQEIASYLHRGTVLAATDGGALVGHARDERRR
jgi:hypothetical protein